MYIYSVIFNTSTVQRMSQILCNFIVYFPNIVRNLKLQTGLDNIVVKTQRPPTLMFLSSMATVELH